MSAFAVEDNEMMRSCRMGKIWEFFDNLNEFVYVSDMDSYELIYLNRRLMELYGLHSLEEISGKKCYELFQNSSRPCAIVSGK